MKKIFLSFFLFSVCLVLLCSCQEDYDENEIQCDDLIKDILYGYNENRIYESCTGNHSFSWMFSCSKARNTSMISGVTSEESKIICGYLSKQTIEEVEKNQGRSVPNCISCQSGIMDANQHLSKYHFLVNDGKLDESKNKIHLYSFGEEKIPMEYNDKILIFVYSVFPLHLANGETCYVYGNMHGSVNGNYYEIKLYNHLESFKNQEFILLSSSLNKYMFFEHFAENSIRIKNDENTDLLYDDGVSIRNCFATYKTQTYYEFVMGLKSNRNTNDSVEPFFDSSEFSYSEKEITAYFEQLKPAILSKEKELISEATYNYDYYKIKEIFNIK